MYTPRRFTQVHAARRRLLEVRIKDFVVPDHHVTFSLRTAQNTECLWRVGCRASRVSAGADKLPRHDISWNLTRLRVQSSTRVCAFTEGLAPVCSNRCTRQC